MPRKRFNQTAILKKLNAKCERCRISARSKNANLSIHHRNHKSDYTDWKNIMIYCRDCHEYFVTSDSTHHTSKKENHYLTGT